MNADRALATDSERGGARAATGWAATTLLVAYTALVHHGIGPLTDAISPSWWEPRNFLTDWAIGEWLVDTNGIALLALPAALLAGVVFAGTRSATARTLALMCVCAVAIFAYYGIIFTRAWEFFSWRGSLVMLATALAVGATLGAPLLAGSWLRLSWRLKLAVYAPICLAVVALVRNATGTDEKLFFNFSPWPAIPVLGMEIGCYSILGVWLGAAVGLGAAADPGRRPVAALLGVLAAIAIPVLWFNARFGNVDGLWLMAFGLAGAVVGLLGAMIGTGDLRAKRIQRATHLAVGFSLVALPLLSGRALATGDYVVTKFVRAQIVIDALASHYEQKDEYPEELDDLVTSGALDVLPRPRIGFQFFYDLGLLADIEFSYRNLGSSYVLEFVSTEWVQCAYNPPWEDEEELDEYDEEYEEGLDSDGAWSCPDTRPELW